MTRRPGLSVRLQLTLSYAGFLMLAGALLLAVVWFFLLRYVPVEAIVFDGIRPGRSDLIEAFAPRAAWAMLFLLVFGLVGGWLLAGRMLAPLDRITAATRLVAAGSLSHRIRLPGRRDEFRELADSFDSMLGQIEANVQAQQRFAANASHELRTPLSITQALLDVAEADPQTDVAGLLQRLRHVNSRAIQLTEALLLLSRADRSSFTREAVDLSLLAEEAAETLLPLADKHGVRIEVDVEPTPVRGSRALLLQLTMNLLHNSIVHNLKQSGFVRLTSGVRDGSAVLAIENSGESLAPELVATLTEPFRRGAERVAEDHAGAGLGLAIVKSVVAAHEGELLIRPRPGGGLRIEVRLVAQ